MANVKKSARVQNADILKLNLAGLSLKLIAEELGCHAATVTARFKEMGVRPTDTRRSFMEGVYRKLDGETQEWLLEHLLYNDLPIQDFMVQLIRQAYRNGIDHTPAPADPSGPSLIDPSVLEQAQKAQADLPQVNPEPLADDDDDGDMAA